MSVRAATCSLQGCAKTTHHASTRCHHHRAGAGAAPGAALAPVPVRRAFGSAGVVAALEATFAAADARDGWEPQTGLPHPSGGYAARTIERDPRDPDPDNVVALVAFRDAGGRYHREDGPASIGYDAEGAEVVRTYLVDGMIHRLDGAATELTSLADLYDQGQEGEWSSHYVADVWRDPGEAASDRAWAAVHLAGFDVASSARWLKVVALVGHQGPVVEMLADPDSDPVAAAAALQAGVSDVAVVTEVSTGRLPLSWALAGAGRG